MAANGGNLRQKAMTIPCLHIHPRLKDLEYANVTTIENFTEVE